MFDVLFETCGALCHQIPDRTFFPGGKQMPFCARCTGIYVNVALSFGFALWAAGKAFRITAVRPLWLVFWLSFIFLAISWIAGFFFVSSPLFLQYASGIPFAWTSTFLLMHSFNGLFWERSISWNPRPGLATPAVIFLAVNAAILVDSQFVFYVFAWGSVVGAFIGFGLLNGIILLNVFTLRQNTFTRPVQFIGALGISFVLTGAETILYGWLFRG